MILPKNIGNELNFNDAKQPASHVILDLESMSTATDCAIISVGAVCCDETYEVTGWFYVPVSLQSSIDAALRVDASTINWWMEQDIEAKNGLALENGITLEHTLRLFTEWWERNCRDSAMLWGNGSDFDNAALAMAYRTYGRDAPWCFWSNQSLRTLRYLNDVLGFYIERPKPYVAHHALYDAYAEALYLKQIMLALHARNALPTLNPVTDTGL